MGLGVVVSPVFPEDHGIYLDFEPFPCTPLNFFHHQSRSLRFRKLQLREWKEGGSGPEAARVLVLVL